MTCPHVPSTKIINNAARSIGITEKIGTHTLRKTFGYHAYQSGVSIGVIQKLFNHSAPSITLRYIGITQDDLDNVYLNLNL
ncbi:tyrosine-type recombinase/integrase [Propionispora sp. 2/2-37]|uniref:tyrosine-type recombinase/integrase n=1 Tax=Propionispora sp. 2/2-37 TaxID=1677858 RepID=UPI00092EDBA9|nr:tyrosine-type recombinase/integrase [Propionispora sp. 2/2-37]